VSYAGTRPQTPAAPAAAVPGQAEAKLSCTSGARFFVKQEEAWWAATVREAAPSGDKCIARIDGGGTDDEVAFAPGETLAWSIDGPGKPVAKCSGGDKVLVENDGAWYPARVINTPAAEGKCPIKYQADENEESVPLKRVRRPRADNEARGGSGKGSPPQHIPAPAPSAASKAGMILAKGASRRPKRRARRTARCDAAGPSCFEPRMIFRGAGAAASSARSVGIVLDGDSVRHRPARQIADILQNFAAGQDRLCALPTCSPW
jgi:hypothetical protein